MGINSELAELKNNAVKQKILDGAFRIFSEKGIEPVTMTDVAKAAGVGVTTVTRYAVGLVYKGESDPERELVMLKRMLMREYAKTTE